ncbi:MAG: hypothetical protein ACT4NK_11870 [Limnobacter sp.]|jgi:small-conductance mechanosensitive channel|uniref:hypothetical protein n=1 Tax=unclassified Limnobacter TaxID=2630203 RepID=UPI000C5F1B77|nr:MULTISPECIES: hypothetical protein [unclassified Limnobacter]MBT84993.1 hypothetical protein [Sutterellaceae bacterium]|tara:strand:+ start:15871 stop:16281 length:411 start_codon:yes stop_codon:yes gene_type:complete
MSKKFDALEARKELLMMKAQLERMEFGGQVDTLKNEFAWVNVFRQFGGWLGQRNMRALGPVASLGGQFWQEGLKKYPLLGMLASTALLRFRKPISQVALRAGLGAVALAAGVFWFQTRSPWASRSATEPSTDPSDS